MYKWDFGTSRLMGGSRNLNCFCFLDPFFKSCLRAAPTVAIWGDKYDPFYGQEFIIAVIRERVFSGYEMTEFRVVLLFIPTLLPFASSAGNVLHVRGSEGVCFVDLIFL